MNKLSNEKIQEIIVNKFDSTVADFKNPYNLLSFTLKDKDVICDLIEFLKLDNNLNFQFLTTLCGVHYPSNATLSVIYHLHNLKTNSRIRFKVDLNESHPYIDSIVHIHPGANWMERETYDFYGIIFKGHPNLKRILNMDDLQVFPMRKEYPLEDPNRVDKKDAQFGR